MLFRSLWLSARPAHKRRRAHGVGGRGATARPCGRSGRGGRGGARIRLWGRPDPRRLASKHEFLYESRTEYDLDSPKKIDLRVGLAHEVIIEKTKDEKIQVLAASNKLCYIAQQVKVKIVEDKKRMDVIVNHSADLSDIAAMENLFIRVRIPEKFVADIELSSELENLKVRDIVFDAIEFDGKVKNAFVTNANGHIELNTNSNVNVEVNGLKGKLDINHFHAVSKIHFADGQNYYLKNAGRFTRFVDSEGKILVGKRNTEDPSDSVDLIVELNGWKSETQVFICANLQNV